jgi:hypothetical protein
MVSELGASVEVKPLEWSLHGYEGTGVAGIQYAMCENGSGGYEVYRPFHATFKTQGAAQQAAQDHYAQSILSALIQPTPAEAEGVCQVCHGTGFTGSGDRTKECACQSRSPTPPPIGDGEGDLVVRLRQYIELGTKMGARGESPSNIYNLADEAVAAIEAINRQVNQYAWERDKAREERDAAESRSEAFWKPQVSTLSRQLEEAREALSDMLPENCDLSDDPSGKRRPSFSKCERARNLLSSALSSDGSRNPA